MSLAGHPSGIDRTGDQEERSRSGARPEELAEAQISLIGVAGFFSVTLSLLRPHWKASFLVLLTMVPEVAQETVQPLLLMVLIDDAIIPGNVWLVAVIIVGLFVLLTCYALGRLANLYMAARAGASATNDLRLKLFEQLQNLSVSFYARRQTGDLVSRFTSDLDAVENALVSDLPFGVSCVFTLIVGAALMFTIDSRLALTIVLLLPLVIIGPRLLGARTNQANYRRQQDMGCVVSALEESIAAHSVVRAFNLQWLMLSRFGSSVAQLFRSTVRAGLFSGLQGASMTAGGHTLLTVAVGAAAFMAVRDELSIGALVALFELAWFVMSSVQEMAAVVPPLQRAAAGMVRIRELLEEQPAVTDAADAVTLPPFSREIEFKEVDFTYTGDEPHLRGISMTIAAGESVAIVGRSGSGKSTMLSLLLRFHDPTNGSISIDGIDLRQVTQASLRAQMGAVFQESLLFKGSIRENIRLGKPGATDQAVEAAAKAAEIHDFILTLPLGYDTDVGERGQRLSGGERQRIALARALLREPAILILDEPASALDPQTEAAINATLDRVSRDRTVVSVTHRLASAAAADRILVLDAARLVEQGTHEELLRREGMYHRLWHQKSRGQADLCRGAADTDVARSL